MSTAPLSEGRWLKNSVHSHGGGGRWPGPSQGTTVNIQHRRSKDDPGTNYIVYRVVVSSHLQTLVRYTITG